MPDLPYLPSKFIKQTLLPEEHVLRDAQFPAPYTFLSFLFFIVIFGSGIMMHKGFKYAGIYTLIPVHAGFWGGLLIFLSMMVRKWTTEIVLTNMRLIYKKGVLAVSSREADIEQLASQDVQQTLMGRIFSYGVVHVRCIEANDFYLPPIDKPYEFRNAVEKQKQVYREKYMKVEHLRRHSEEGPAEHAPQDSTHV